MTQFFPQYLRQLADVSFSLYDIDKQTKVTQGDNESVLSFGVNVLNERLLQSIPTGSKILEIGCGRSSYFKANLSKNTQWLGLDLYENDGRGVKSIATHIGSVHEMPFENHEFDFVLANQSLEHWFEYNVAISDALTEVGRVLKTGGEAWLNFPLFLHGDPRCLSGNVTAILGEIPRDLFSEIRVEFLKSNNNGNYEGWRYCGFPDFLVNSKTSINVNLILTRNSQQCAINQHYSKLRPLSKLERLSSYGFRFLLWKSVNWMLGWDRKKNAAKN